MNDWTIYHNPRCSKSRAALDILQKRGIEPQVIEYLKSPPDAKSLKELLKKLGLRARDILRDGEEEYATLGLENEKLTDDQLLDAIASHPILLQRPIIVRGEQAVIGRPPEAVKELM